MKRLFATPSAIASNVKLEWVRLFAKDMQVERQRRAEQGPVVRTKAKGEAVASPLCVVSMFQ